MPISRRHPGSGPYPSLQGLEIIPLRREPPTQLWLAARYLQALSLLAAPLVHRRRPPLAALLTAYLGVTILLLAAAIWGACLPPCEGQGLTPFQDLERVPDLPDPPGSPCSCCSAGDSASIGASWPAWVSSIDLTIASELAFTAYISPYGPANMIGPSSKILAFYFLYRPPWGGAWRIPTATSSSPGEKTGRAADHHRLPPPPDLLQDLESRFIRSQDLRLPGGPLSRGHGGQDRGGALPPGPGPGLSGARPGGDPQRGAQDRDREAPEHPDGSALLTIDKIPYRDRESDRRVIGFAVDITERKEAAEALEAERQALQKALHEVKS